MSDCPMQVELTPKRYKALQAIGAVILLTCLILSYLARTYGYTEWTYAATAGAVFGSFIHVAGKSLELWNHG